MQGKAAGLSLPHPGKYLRSDLALETPIKVFARSEYRVFLRSDLALDWNEELTCIKSTLLYLTPDSQEK